MLASQSPPVAGQPQVSSARRLRAALAGNPNAGKTTLFNSLTGGRAKVANYPGVTVDTRVGRWADERMVDLLGGPLELVDVPGCYALTARSPEEALAIATIRGKADVAGRPDVIVDVVDATNLERNLYLTLQLLELRIPVVVVLTMVDLLERSGGRVDTEALSRVLGTPVVISRRGEAQSRGAIAEALLLALSEPVPGRVWSWPSAECEAAVEALAARLVERGVAEVSEADGVAHWYIGQAGEHEDGNGPSRPLAPGLSAVEATVVDALDETLAALERELAPLESVDGRDPAAAAISLRYAWLAEHVRALVDDRADGRSLSDRIDAVITHRIVGPVLFLAVMAVVFQLMFAWSDPVIGAIEGLMAAASSWIRASLAEGPLTDLLAEGVVAGVGNVLVFLPQIVILFALLAVLEATGYLARAAYIMDRVMSKVGLHGKAFVPLLTSFACAVPGIAATRTIENRRDRFVTILVAPLMTCSARLPVYALLIAVFFEAGRPVFGVFTLGGLLLLGLYLAGAVSALLVATLLRRTIFRGPRPPLILELPPYHLPRLRDVWQSVRDRTWVFVRDAGTVILACTVVLWGVLSYPEASDLEASYQTELVQLEALAPSPDAPDAAHSAHDAARRQLTEEYNTAVVEQSMAGRVGRFIEPVFEPLGFNLRVTIGLIAALSAREVMVSALGVSYGMEEDVDEESGSLRAALAQDSEMSPAVALSLLVWFVFAFQCIATLAAVRRETRSWRWPLFLIGYQTTLAWVASFVTYRVATAAGLG